MTKKVDKKIPTHNQHLYRPISPVEKQFTNAKTLTLHSNKSSAQISIVKSPNYEIWQFGNIARSSSSLRCFNTAAEYKQLWQRLQTSQSNRRIQIPKDDWPITGAIPWNYMF